MAWFRTWWFLSLAACPALEPAESWQPVVRVDEGGVCFAPGDGGVDVLVVLSDCLSSSCSRNLQGACEATVDGASITLTSNISWEENVSPEAECTADCGVPTANCTIEGLADGTYSVVYGEQTLELVVPLSETAACSVL